jgi:hypothetical protein
MKKILPLVVLVLIVVAGIYYFSMDRVNWKTVTSSTLNLSFTYPVHSSMSADPLKGTVSTVIAYDHNPTNPKDWTIYSNVKKAIIANMNCEPLLGSGVFLPIDTSKPLQCGVSKSAAGLVSVYLIGLGRPDNGTSYPESMILTLKDSNAAMITKIVKFPETEKLANEKVTTFTHLHPQAVIWPPDDNAKKMYSDVEAVVTKSVSDPSAEVVSGIELLRKISETMKSTN